MESRSFMRSLRGRITLQMLAVGLVPLIIVGLATLWVMFQFAGDFSRSINDSTRIMEHDVVGHNLAHRAGMITDDMDTYLHERMRDVLVWASAPVVVEAAAQGATLAEEQGLVGLSEDEVERQMERTRSLNVSTAATRYIVDQMEESGVFKEIFFTESHGFNVALTGLTSDFLQKGEDWWDGAWEQGIHVESVEYDESAAVYSIAISARIDDTLGVMKTVLDSGAVQAIASQAAAEIPDSQVMVFSSDGLLLADTESGHDPGVVMSDEHNLLSEGYQPAVLATQATEDQPSGFVLEEVAGYGHSAGSEFYADIPGFDGFNWGAVVTQRRETAFAPIEGLVGMQQAMNTARNFSTTLFVVVTVLVAAAAVVLALYLSRGIIQPVVRLSAAADSISRGDLDVPIAVTSGDEIGDLAESIERMRASLKAAIERLRR
jgi:HAMP domain-containing protein